MRPTGTEKVDFNKQNTKSKTVSPKINKLTGRTTTKKNWKNHRKKHQTD
jgi:hypothetical protein